METQRRRSWKPVICILCIGTAAFLSRGCSGDGKDKFPKAEKTKTIEIKPIADSNLILIHIDSLRADRLGCYGNTEVDTSNIDGLADRGIQFEYAFSGTPQTLPSYASIMTGTTPLQHGVRGDELFYLADDKDTLAEYLKHKGFKTAAFLARFALNRMFGLAQGFDLYDDDFGMPRGPDVLDQLQEKQEAEKVVGKALNWLRKNKDSRFFMWLHFSDLISPNPPPAYLEQYSTNPYDGALAYIDNSLGHFLEKLRDLGLYNKSLIVLTSDHGVGLGEHGEIFYGQFLYDTTLHIPLIFHNPEIFKGARDVTAMARNIDLFPTILELLGMAPPHGIQGKSLISAIQDDSVRPNLELYCENTFPYFIYRWSGQKGIRTEDWKYVYSPKEELYHLSGDPHEGNNLARENPGKLKEMRQRLATLNLELAAGTSYPDLDPAREPDAVLEHFGYASSFAPLGQLSFVNPALKDSKDGLMVIKELLKATAARTVDKNVPESIKMFDQILSKEPQNTYILKAQANNYLSLGQYAEAVRFYRKALDLESFNPLTCYYLARSYIGSGNAEEAQNLLRKAISINPGISFFHSDLGSLYVLMQQENKAVKSYKKAIQLFKYDIASRYNLSSILIKRGKIDEAKAQLDKALAFNPSYDLALKQLGRISLMENNYSAAEDYFKRSLMFKQNEPEVTFFLAQSIEKQGRIDDALELYKKFLTIAPSYLQRQIEWVKAHIKELSRTPPDKGDSKS